MNTGEKIKKEMISRGISQNQLAKCAMISQSGLSSIVNGAVSPKEETLRAIADALNVSVSYLIGDEQPARTSEPALPRQEQAILLLFRSMNDNGQQVAMDMLRSLAMNPAFQRDNKKTAIPAV